jgi:hypothetical protein
VSTYPSLSASERWGRHYFSCDICQVDEFDPTKDRLCWLGAMLRDASIETSKGPPLVIMNDGPLVCLLCQESLLPFPVFWIDRWKDGIHEACEEQRLVDQELEDALRNEAGL